MTVASLQKCLCTLVRVHPVRPAGPTADCQSLGSLPYSPSPKPMHWLTCDWCSKVCSSAVKSGTDAQRLASPSAGSLLQQLDLKHQWRGGRTLRGQLCVQQPARYEMNVYEDRHGVEAQRCSRVIKNRHLSAKVIPTCCRWQIKPSLYKARS